MIYFTIMAGIGAEGGSYYVPGKDYSSTYADLINWSDSMRETLPRTVIKPEERPLDRDLVRSSQSAVLEFMPRIHRALASTLDNNEIVFSDVPVDSFPQSPYAQLHVSTQNLRRAMMAESLERAENFRQVPEDIKRNLANAWRQIQLLPPAKAPILHEETVINLARLPQSHIFVWEQFKDGYKQMEALLRRTLAVKYGYSQASPVLGYNKRAVHLCDLMLLAQDALATCTPWQMEWDSSAFERRVHERVYAHINEDRLKLGEHLAEGKMWSDEMAQNQGVRKWMEALTTGDRP